MFDKHITNHQTTVTPVTRVIEKTITPDKVTEMYDKTKQEIEESLIRKIIIKSAFVEFSACVFQNPQDCTVTVKGRFLINGTEFLVEHILKEALASNEQIYSLLYQDFVDQLIFKTAAKPIYEIIYKK